MLSSPAAIQIRQLDALQNMARQSGSKVIFVPMNLLPIGEGIDGANGTRTGSGDSTQIATLQSLANS